MRTTIFKVTFIGVYILLLLHCSHCMAQGGKPINTYVTVKTLNKNNNQNVTVGKGCVVYVFKTQTSAQEFINDIRHKHSLSLENPLYQIDNFLPFEHSDTTNLNGECDLIARSNAYLAAYKPSGYYITKKPVAINNKGEVEVIVEPLVEEMVDSLAVVTDTFPDNKIIDVTYDCGDQRVIDLEWKLSREETNSTCRYGLAPFCIEVSGEEHGFTSEYQKDYLKSGKIFQEMKPRLIDGDSYKKTQYRRMGYDNEHDSLWRYKENFTVASNDTRRIAFHVRETLYDLKPNTLYPVYAYKWCENYKSVLLKEMVKVNNGYKVDKTKFLDFDFPDVKINYKFYERPPRADITTEPVDLRIEFVNGEARILPTDSVGLNQLNEIIQRLVEINSDKEAKLFTVNVHGYASPEGGRAINERLCKSRAAYLRQQIIDRLGSHGIEFTSEGDVATWKELADSLRADSVFDPENIRRAMQIEDAIASTRDEQGVEAKLRGLPLYKFLKDNEDRYYKKLRKVRITFDYTHRKILTEKQVIDRYERTKSANFPYQYQYLFKYLEKRPEELERIAKKAMKEVYEPTGKPWTLAAYYLAKSYTARSICDTTLLKPYITFTGKECSVAYPGSYLYKTRRPTLLNSRHVSMDGDTIQIMNDEAIVVQQISMFVQADKIKQALTLARNLFPANDSVYKKPIMMLESKCEKKYNEREYREQIAATSEWNKVVVYAAQDAHPDLDKTTWQDAWNTLNDTTVFKLNTSRELYMKAILAYRLYESAQNWNKRTDMTPVPKSFFDAKQFSIYDAPDFSDEKYPWGSCMIKACEMDPSFINILKFDGEFNQNYRDGFAIFWNEKHPDKILK